MTLGDGSCKIWLCVGLFQCLIVFDPENYHSEINSLPQGMTFFNNLFKYWKKSGDYDSLILRIQLQERYLLSALESYQVSS